MTEDELPTGDDAQEEDTTEQSTTGPDKPISSTEQDRRRTTPAIRIPTDTSSQGTTEQPTAATDTKPSAPPSPFTKETPTPPSTDAKPVTARPTDATGTDTGAAPGSIKPPAAAKPAVPQTGGGNGNPKHQTDKTGTDQNGLPDLSKIDPSKALQIGTGLISPAISAFSALPTGFASMLTGLLSPLQALKDLYGKGTPTTPQQNSGTGKIEEIVNSLGGVNPTAALGTGKASAALQSKVGGQKTKATALETLDQKLEKALTDSKANTLLGRDKIQTIIDQVNTNLQALGPVANTPAGQAQVFATISQALTQAGAVVSKTMGEDAVSSDNITQIGNEFVQTANTGNPTSSSDGSTRLTSDTALGSLTSNSSKEEVAAAIIAEAKRRGYSDEAAIAILSTAWQESNLDPNADGGDQGIGGALSIFQQGAHYGADRTDPNVNINNFFDRMERTGGSGSGQDIWQQIVGIQQHDGAWAGTAGDQWYLGTIQNRLGEATAMFNKLVSA